MKAIYTIFAVLIVLAGASYWGGAQDPRWVALAYVLATAAVLEVLFGLCWHYLRSFFWRIVFCVVPVVLAGWAVGRAFYLYEQGRGGFKLGVDLVGGTILVYEVDPDKRQQDNY